MAKYAKMATNPLVVTGVVLLGSLAALASMESVNHAFHWVPRVAGFHGLADTLYVSQLAIANIWFWRFLFGCMVWGLLGFFTYHTSVFDRVSSKTAPTTPEPVQVLPKKPKVSEVSSKLSSKDSGEEDPRTSSPLLNTCYAGWLLLEGGYDKPLDRMGCKNFASFIIPVSGTDTIADFPGKKPGGHTMNDLEVCALCNSHMKEYQKHITACTCSVADCDKYGTSFPTKKGAKRMCSDHAKSLILNMENPQHIRGLSPPLARGLSTKKAESNIKGEEGDVDLEMPPLGPIPEPKGNASWSNPSRSVSTGSTNSSFERKLKEIGGD